MGRSAEELREPDAGVVRTHPRQAFDRGNFIDGGSGAPFSFDPTALAGARGLASAQDRPPERHELLAAPLEPAGSPTTSIELSELSWFFAHPVKAFFENRLNVAVPAVAEGSASQLPTSLSRRDIAAVGGELLTVGLGLARPDDVIVDPETGDAVAPVRAVIDRFRARGLLPPPAASRPEMAEISQEVSAMLAMAERYDVRRPARLAHPIDLPLSSGVRLVGSVNGCIDGAHPGPVRIAFHRGRPRDEIWLTLDLLVLAASDPDTSWRGVAVARPDKDQSEPVVTVRAVRGANGAERRANAVAALEVLVAQYRDGLCYPIPLFEKTSFATHAGAKASQAWDPGFGDAPPREGEDGYHLLAFGALRYHELTRIEPGGYRLEVEAERLWGTLARAVVDRSEDDVEAAEP
jgi:exodeoxyribonuclease V gamma subunit